MDFLLTVLRFVAEIAALILLSFLAFWVFQRFVLQRRDDQEGLNSIARAIGSWRAAQKSAALEKAVVYEPRVDREVIDGLIRGYHEQALRQADTQFWFSVIAAAVGFAWILYAGSRMDAKNLGAAMQVVPGVIVDVVAVLFFRQAAETRQRASDLFDRLRKDDQLLEALGLVERIEDARMRGLIEAQIALQLAGLQPAALDLMAAYAVKPAPEPQRAPSPVPATIPVGAANLTPVPALQPVGAAALARHGKMKKKGGARR
jgi:membrane protein implicated in regulation of membrane protease activity